MTSSPIHSRGTPVNAAHAAYGALWCMVTDNPVIHAARNHLLASIGGRGSAAQREAIKWAGRNVQPPSDAEVAAVDLFPVEAGDVGGWRPGDLHTAMMVAIREDIIRQHPDAFTEDTDAEIVIPVGAVPVSLYCKIDVSALAEAALAAASPPLAEGQGHE